MSAVAGLVVSEKAWMRTIIDLAERQRWRVYHTHDSRRSAPGFPDLVLVRGPRLVFAEVKTDTGRVSVPQREWLDALTKVANATTGLWCNGDSGVEVFVWRPRDWPQIEEALR